MAGSFFLLLLTGGFGWWGCIRKRKIRKQTPDFDMQPADEEHDLSYYAPKIVEKRSTLATTDLELKGRVVGELAAPYEHSRPNNVGRTEIYGIDAAELECLEPVYELPTWKADR